MLLVDHVNLQWTVTPREDELRRHAEHTKYTGRHKCETHYYTLMTPIYIS